MDLTNLLQHHQHLESELLETELQNIGLLLHTHTGMDEQAPCGQVHGGQVVHGGQEEHGGQVAHKVPEHGGWDEHMEQVHGARKDETVNLHQDFALLL